MANKQYINLFICLFIDLSRHASLHSLLYNFTKRATLKSSVTDSKFGLLMSGSRTPAVSIESRVCQLGIRNLTGSPQIFSDLKSYKLKFLERFIKGFQKWHLNVFLIDASLGFQVNGTLQV